jgi:16S rRNA (uracil1498-N3)-methyltransferase
MRSGGEDEVLLAIGPEGGWTQDELDQFQKEGWVSASLGSTILRAETAAIAATAVTMASLSR